MVIICISLFLSRAILQFPLPIFNSVFIHIGRLPTSMFAALFCRTRCGRLLYAYRFYCQGIFGNSTLTNRAFSFISDGHWMFFSFAVFSWKRQDNIIAIVKNVLFSLCNSSGYFLLITQQCLSPLVSGLSRRL